MKRQTQVLTVEPASYSEVRDYMRQQRSRQWRVGTIDMHSTFVQAYRKKVEQKLAGQKVERS